MTDFKNYILFHSQATIIYYNGVKRECRILIVTTYVYYLILCLYSTPLQNVNRFTGALWCECICNTCNVTSLYKMWFTHKHTFAEYNTLRKGPVNTKCVSNRISVNAVDVTLFNIMYTYNACVPCNEPYIQGGSPSVPAPDFGFIRIYSDYDF